MPTPAANSQRKGKDLKFISALRRKIGSSTQTTRNSSNNSSTLRSDFIWTFVGNAIYAACQWAILVLLAKKGSPELVGYYAFAVAVATPVVAFTNMQLRSVQMTDVREDYSFGEYLGFRLWTTLSALVLLTGICLVMRYPLRSTILIETIGLALAVETVSDLYYGVLQTHGRMDRIAKSMIARGVLSLAAMTAVLACFGNLIAAVAALAFSRILVTLTYDIHWALKGIPGGGGAGLLPQRFRRPRWSLRNQIAIMRLAFPIGLVTVLVSLNSSIPRYFIQWSLGARELGIFSALCFFSSSGNMISAALGQAAFARLAKSYGNCDYRAFSRLLFQLLAVGCLLGIAGVAGTALCGKEVLRILYKPEYAARSGLLVLLMTATGLGYLAQFVGYAVTSARLFAPQIPLFVAVGSTLAFTCYLLVPRAGLSGAVFALMITAVVQLLGAAGVLFFALKRHLVSPSLPQAMATLEPCDVSNS